MRKALVFVLACACCLAVAQDAAPPAGPSAELKKLAFTIGEWTGTFNMSMGGNDMQMQCEVKAEWVQKSNFIRTTMSVDMPNNGGKMEGVTYLSYDPEAKTYKSYGFDDMSPQPREDTGTFDGTKLVMTSKPWSVMGQPAAAYRTTYEQKGDAVTMLLEVKQGDAWTKFGEATFKKKTTLTKTAVGGG